MELEPQLATLLSGIRASTDALERELGRKDGPAVEPIDLARRLYEQGKVCDRYFPGLFRDPAWFLMLDLYIARVEGRATSVSSACRATRAPATTGLRYIRAFEEAGYVVRTMRSDDRRLVLVELTQTAADRMSQLLARLGDQFQRRH